ncbi:methyltransferase [Actinomadura sp. 9N407]|uniref:methyltransferase n=1 Tax=Actinomadura sp. 9N407 TaxID=3375154 RepID=UPI0037A671D1
MSDAERAAVGAAVRQLLGDSLGYLYPAALRVAVRTKIADHLADGPLPPDRLAVLAGAEPDHLRRVLRFLATRGVFREDEDGAFHLTTAASLLRADSPLPMSSVVQLLTDELYWLPAGRLEDTVRKGTTAFADIFGAPLFDYLAGDEERGALFHTALDDLSATEHGGIVASYDFADAKTVVDVGGGRGGLLHEALSRNEHLRGVLLDDKSVVAEHRLDDPAIAGRWELVGGDFFTDMPAGADVYVLKRILHDWDDANAVRLLRGCRDAMAGGGRVLVVDTVVPPGNEPHTSKVSDLAMMIVFDGKERTEDELAGLFAQAGLRLNRVVTTPGTLSIVEAVAA